jgi:homogentisate 1,2-dioxygenase
MPHYQKIGQIPSKRHTQFRKPNGELYSEELVSTEGFSNIYSTIYHHYPPTRVKEVGVPYDVAPKISNKQNMQHRCYNGFQITPENDYLESRKAVLVNGDCHISLAAPRTSMTDYFYKNSGADEVIFVHIGTGKLRTIYGELSFKYGDYIVIPRGTVYQIQFDEADNRLFIIESFTPITYPKRYRNDFGQLLENSPYCERDIVVPTNLQTHDEPLSRINAASKPSHRGQR